MRYAYGSRRSASVCFTRFSSPPAATIVMVTLLFVVADAVQIPSEIRERNIRRNGVVQSRDEAASRAEEGKYAVHFRLIDSLSWVRTRLSILP